MRSVSVQGSTAIVDGKKVIHLCSNDYLGLSRDPRVITRAARALDEISPSSSRLIAGNNPQIAALERLLASHCRNEAALVFPTGYMANLGALSALADENTTILSDELNHASIIDACRLSGAKIKVFRHNDVQHLELLIKKSRKRRIVITEGVFSMDGDLARLNEICKIARENDAMSVIDDAHGDFVFGRNYSGVPELLETQVDVHVSSLSKALGCFGGYVAASKSTIELLINTSKQFIYTSALPDHLCIAAEEAIRLAKKGNLQAALFENARFLRDGLQNTGFILGNSNSQIIPILIGQEDAAMKVSNQLLAAGVFAQAVRYPTVRKGSARLRLSVTATHNKEQLQRAIEALAQVGKRSKIISPR